MTVLKYPGSKQQKSGFRNNIAGNNGNLSSYHTRLPAEIITVSNRLKSTEGKIVQIENWDALNLIEKYNRRNVLIYLDPPYLLSTRKNRKIYTHEMEYFDHE
jgi:DNA adenine methylase